MKKISALAVLLFMVIMANAQFTSVNYRGAFAPAPTPMWTDNWTNWDPNSTTYRLPAPNTKSHVVGIVSGVGTTGLLGAGWVQTGNEITVDTHWSADTVYELRGLVYVKAGATLTIDPGTLIEGNGSYPNSSLIICKGGKINAVGTPSAPIVFTSQAYPGLRAPGQWGGVILLGKAHLNATSDNVAPIPNTYGINYIEGITEVPNTEFGGGSTPDDHDNSGIMKYVRIEYGGYIFAQNKEINGLTLGAVGDGTILDYIQVSFSNDDAFEWFGGTVNPTHLVSYRGVDDEWDTDNGFSGHIQFCLGVRDPQIADNSYSLASGGSTSEGYEADNDANSSLALPKTKCVFSNMTNIGPLRGNNSAANLAAIHPGFRRCARLRRNVEEKIFNSLMFDYPRGLMIDGNSLTTDGSGSQTTRSTEFNAIDGLVKFQNNIVGGYQAGRLTELASSATSVFDSLSNKTSFNIAAFFRNGNNDTASAVSVLTAPYGVGTYPTITTFTKADYRPKAGSLALSNYDYSDTSFGTVTPCTTPSTPSAISGLSNVNKCDSFQTYSVTNVAGVIYVWSVVGAKDTIVSGQGTNSIKIKFATGSTGGTVSVVAINACGSSTASSLVVVKKKPTTPGAITASSTNFCVATSTPATFKIKQVAGATGYFWKLSNVAGLAGTITHLNAAGPQDTAITILFTSVPTVATGAQVQVYALSACDTSLVKFLALTRALPGAPTVLTASLTDVCPVVGTSTTVTYKTKPTANTLTYNWSLQNGSFATIAHVNPAGPTDTIINVTFNSGFTFDSVFVSASNGCTTSLVKKLRVSATLVPATPVISSNTASFNACIGDVVTYTATSTATATSGSAATYGWVLPLHLSIASATTDSSSITVNVLSGYTGGTLKAFAKSACGINSIIKTQALTHTGCAAGTRVSAPIAATTAQLYPNPNNGNFTVRIQTGVVASSNATVKIANMFGQVVAEYAAVNKGGLITLNVANNKLISGVYNVIYTIDGVSNTIKMTVQK